MDKIISYCDFYYIENEGKNYKPVNLTLKIKNEIKNDIDFLNRLECNMFVNSLNPFAHRDTTSRDNISVEQMMYGQLSGSHYDEQFVNSLPFRSDPGFYNWEVIIPASDSVVSLTNSSNISNIYVTDSTN